MSRYEKEMAELEHEFEVRRKGLQAARGRIAEAEALSAEINRAIKHSYATAPAVFTNHSTGTIVSVLVVAHHAAVRHALRQLGIAVASEAACTDAGSVTSILTLADFSVPVRMFEEPAIQEAA